MGGAVCEGQLLTKGMGVGVKNSRLPGSRALSSPPPAQPCPILAPELEGLGEAIPSTPCLPAAQQTPL